MLTTLLFATLLHAASPTTTAPAPLTAVESHAVLPAVELPGLAAVAAVVGALVVAWETLGIPPKVLFSVALVAGTFLGAAAVAGLVVLWNARRDERSRAQRV